MTSSIELFKELAKLGRELVALHLMEFDVVGAGFKPAQINGTAPQHGRTGLKPAPTKKQIPVPKDDWQTWLALSQWAKETMSINTFWVNFALDISNKLKNGTKLSEKEKNDMKKCWGQAVKKGFVDSNI